MFEDLDAALERAAFLLRKIHADLFDLDTDDADVVADCFDEALTEIELASDAVARGRADAVRMLSGRKSRRKD